MKLHDTFTTTTELPNIPKGTEVTVIHIYTDNVYEVECTINGETTTQTISL